MLRDSGSFDYLPLPLTSRQPCPRASCSGDEPGARFVDLLLYIFRSESQFISGRSLPFAKS